MRPIDADALKEAIVDYPYGFRGMIYEDINAQPTIEPKHGKWIFRSIESPYRWECNKCGDKVRARYNYCPNCGARME